jgi:hypothetical protein
MLKNAYTSLIKPTADTANDVTVADVVGTKADTVAGTSVIARLKQLIAVVGVLSDEELVETLMGRSYTVGKHMHSRQINYPSTAAGITLTASTSANIFGTIVEVIPTTSNEVNTLTVTSASASAGNITLNLNGKNFVCAIAGGNASTVAGQLRALTFADSEYGNWAVTGSGADVIFTRAGFNDTGFTASAGGTGFTGTWVKTTTGAGIPKPFDLHGLQIGAISAAGTFVVRLYKGAAGLEEVISSRRTTCLSTALLGGEVATQTEILPAGTRVSAAVSVVGGGTPARTLVLSLSLHTY